MSQAYNLTLCVSYNANNGSGAPSDQISTVVTDILPHAVSITLSSTRPSRTGYTFLGWSTSSSASNASYSPGGSYSYTFGDVGQYNLSHTTTLYAVWKKQTYNVSYMKGSSGTGTDVTDKKTYNVALTLRGAIFTRTAYEQVGWATTDGGAQSYSLGASYTANEAITLYPVWKKITYAYIKLDDTWKDTQVYIKVGGSYKEIIGAYVKVDGVWKPT